MTNKIIWEKWIDPFLSNLDEVELPDDDVEEDRVGYKDSYERAEITQRAPAKKNYTGPVIVGPMGIIPLNEHNTPSKVYCFWMGHTNFNITEAIAKKISEVPGVEALDVFTRYRFRIAIGKAFLDTSVDEHGKEKDPFGGNVLKAIVATVCKDKQEVTQVTPKDIALNSLKNHLRGKYPYWAIYVLPDGEYKVDHADSKEEVERHIKESKDKVVAASWE